MVPRDTYPMPRPCPLCRVSPVSPRPLSPDPRGPAVHRPHENGLGAPMPGKVIQVLVAEGDTVEENARLVVMEAMKMEFTIRAPHAGQVARLPVQVGQLVDAGAVLVEIK